MGIDEDAVAFTETKNNDTLVDIAKALVKENEWKWIKACGSFLLKAGDNDMKYTLQRYASGQFLQEELEMNKDSGITKEEMQAFAKQILEQK